jgi:glutathione S-transferase
MFLAEKGVVLPTTDINIMDGTHFQDGYKGRIGSHHVPALELEDGTVLTETTAICRYLEALYPAPNLLGVDPLEAAKIEMWSRRMEFQFLLPIAQVLRHGNPAMAVLENPQCPEWAAHNVPKVAAAVDWLEGILSQTRWIAGDRFTNADIIACVGVDFLRPIRVPIPERNTATHAWHARMKERAAYVP